MPATDNLFQIAHAKERAERTLAHAFSQGVLDEEELDERMEALAHAEDLAAVERLILDLDLPPEDERALATQELSTRQSPRALVPLGELEPARQILTIFGETEQRGSWTPAQNNRVITVLGSGTFDFREARLGPGVTDVEVRCVLGEVIIIVPPDLPVEIACNAILAEVEHEEHYGELATSGPRLRITGFAILSSIEVKERERGESFWQARKRRKRERKRLKKERKQKQLEAPRGGRRDT